MVGRPSRVHPDRGLRSLPSPFVMLGKVHPSCQGPGSGRLTGARPQVRDVTVRSGDRALSDVTRCGFVPRLSVSTELVGEAPKVLHLLQQRSGGVALGGRGRGGLLGQEAADYCGRGLVRWVGRLLKGCDEVVDVCGVVVPVDGVGVVS